MVKRILAKNIETYIKKHKSILLLGPRQTGKTTLIKEFKSALYLNLAKTNDRRRYELNPDLIIKEVAALNTKQPLIIIDEIQKAPAILDPIQTLIDDKQAWFILTGSSARKLRRQSEINLLPGRVIDFRMDPFTNLEFPQELEQHLLYGSLPAVSLSSSLKEKTTLLRSYVDIYLEEEIRAEAIVRNLPAFYRFLELAALESGKIVSFNSLSQNIGVAHTTISSYYEILEDCLMTERIDPITESTTRKKLTKSSKYLFFDMGVRRLAANEGASLGINRMGDLFENFVGLEILRYLRDKSTSQLKFWRDPDGPEIDWVIQSSHEYIPIEVKYKSDPNLSDCKHLLTFHKEYPTKDTYVICQTPRKYKIAKNITALPWQEIESICKNLE